MSPSLLSRLGNDLRPDADGFATLVRWLNMPAEQFMIDPTATGELTRARPRDPARSATASTARPRGRMSRIWRTLSERR